MGRILDVLIYGPADRVNLLSRSFESMAIRSRSIRQDSPPPQKKRLWSAAIILTDNDTEVRQAIAVIATFTKARVPVVVVSPCSYPTDEQVDAWIREPAPAIQIAARVRALARLDAMEQVAQRRSQVTALYGERSLHQERLETPLSVLYVGDATPKFMALRHALAEAGTDVVASFSSYSAFDYLHERSFDAVVLNAMDRRDSAFTISSAMRRNARLYHTPVLLLSNDQDDESVEESFARGVSDILPPEADDVEIRDRVLSLAHERRRRRDAKAALEACRDPRTLDVETGLFHPAFIASHLQDLLNEATLNESTFSLCVLQAGLPVGSDRPDDAAAEKARRQFAAMLRHLLRAEDAAARLNSDTFVAVLPYTDRAGVDCVAARISAIAECTAFESSDPIRPFRLEVVTSAIETSGDETAEALIERAVRSLRASPGHSYQA
jgi:two-component system cell cycle response regulator PopA